MVKCDLSEAGKKHLRAFLRIDIDEERGVHHDMIATTSNVAIGTTKDSAREDASAEAEKAKDEASMTQAKTGLHERNVAESA